MSTSAEKLVKQTIKLLAKTQKLDYEELKVDAKKVIKMARNFDEELFGTMEELLDLSNVGSFEELSEFDVDVLKIYCKIKDIDDSGSDKSIRQRVWENMEEEFELSESVSGSDGESVTESETSEKSQDNSERPEKSEKHEKSEKQKKVKSN